MFIAFGIALWCAGCVPTPPVESAPPVASARDSVATFEGLDVRPMPENMRLVAPALQEPSSRGGNNDGHATHRPTVDAPCEDPPPAAEQSEPKPLRSTPPGSSRTSLAQQSLDHAVAALDRGDVREGWLLITDALQLDPMLVNAWMVRGMMQERRHDLDGARESYRRCIALAPGDPLTINNLGLLELRAGNPVAAENHFRAAIELADLAPLHNNLGLSLREQGRDDEAEAAFERARELDPGLPEPLANLGLCRERRGDLVGAAEAYRGYLRNGGDPADPRLEPLRTRWRDLGAPPR